MRRVTREDRWGKWTNKQVTRWVGSRQFDMRAHGTQKTKAMCSHKSPAMCKTGHEHAAEKTHKSRVHTRHDNMKARSQWNTQAACHTAQDITLMHASDKNTNCVQQQNTRGQKSVRPSELETAHSHKETERGARVSEPRHENETQDMSAGIRTPRYMKQGT